jgi:uncharacterized membrane protein
VAQRVARDPMRSVWTGVALFVFCISALATDRYVTYHYGADLGLFTQTIAAAFHGFGNQVEHGSHFIVHFSPIYYLVALPFAAARSPLTLQVFQAISCALVAPPLYLFARKRTDARLAALIACTALLYPPLLSMSLSEFHENAFAPAAIAWLIWAVDERHWSWAALFAALALSIKEDEAVILFALGAAFAVWSMLRRDRVGALFGASVALTAVAVFALFFLVIQPHAGGRWFISDFYLAHTKDLPHGAVVVTGRLTFLLEVFGPLLFLPLMSRWIWLAVPGFIEVLSSRWPVTYTMGTHYAGVWIPYVLIAFAAAVASLAAKDLGRARKFVWVCIALCVLNLAVASPTHWAHYYRLRNAHDAALDRIIATIPAGADVGSYDEAYTHMSLDPNARIGMYITPDYFLYDRQFDSMAWRRYIVPRLAAVVCTGYFVPIREDDGLVLFKRVKDVPEEVYARARRVLPTCKM